MKYKLKKHSHIFRNIQIQIKNTEVQITGIQKYILQNLKKNTKYKNRDIKITEIKLQDSRNTNLKTFDLLLNILISGELFNYG